MTFELPESLKPLSDLTIKIVVGALAFIVAFYAAVGLAIAVRFAEAHVSVPAWLVTTAGWMEFGIWAGDAVIVSVFIAKEALGTLIELVTGRRLWK